MIHSRSFETTDKLEISLYDLGAVESNSGFLSSGVMNADFNTPVTVSDYTASD